VTEDIQTSFAKRLIRNVNIMNDASF